MSIRHPILARAIVPLLVVAALAACGGSGAATADPTGAAEGGPDVARLYTAACAACHGPHGDGGSSGVPLGRTSTGDRRMVVGAIRDGLGAMPASGGGMSDEQIDALADYVVGLR